MEMRLNAPYLCEAYSHGLDMAGRRRLSSARCHQAACQLYASRYRVGVDQNQVGRRLANGPVDWIPNRRRGYTPTVCCRSFSLLGLFTEIEYTDYKAV